MKSHLLLIPLCTLFCGCSSLVYIGNSNELGDAGMPSGFVISPSEAHSIVNDNRGHRKMVDDVYYDKNFYYFTSAPFGSKASTAKNYGYMVDGRTGRFYDQHIRE